MNGPILTRRKLKHLVSISLRNISVPDGAYSQDDPANEKIQPTEKQSVNSTIVADKLSMSSDPLRNQYKLQSLNECKFFDCFFTLTEEGSQQHSTNNKNEDISGSFSRRNHDKNRGKDKAKQARPFYISEVVENTLSPNFNDINLVNFVISNADVFDQLCQQTTFKLTIFVRNMNSRNWRVLLSVLVNLEDLLFLGKSLTEVDSNLQSNERILNRRTHSFGSSVNLKANSNSNIHGMSNQASSQGNDKNVVLLNLVDGVYYLPLIPVKRIKEKLRDQPKKTPMENPTSFSSKRQSYVSLNDQIGSGVQMLNYDMIMKLNNLKLCIIDMKKINYQLSQSIEKKLTIGPKSATKKQNINKEPQSKDSEEGSVKEISKQVRESLPLCTVTSNEDRLLAAKIYRTKLLQYRKAANLLKKNNLNIKKKLNVKRKYLTSLKAVVEDQLDLNSDEELNDASSLDKIKFKYIDDEEETENMNGYEYDDHKGQRNMTDSHSKADKTKKGKTNNDQNQFNSILLSIDSDIDNLKEIYGNNLNRLNQINFKINLEVLKIFKVLTSIFNIVPNSKNPIEFKILNLKLSNLCYFIKYPNYKSHSKAASSRHYSTSSANRGLFGNDTAVSDREDKNLNILSKEELQIEIDCALGYVSQLVHLISLYLLIPLKYPIVAFGSYSFICDYVSDLNNNSSKVFPLHLQKNGLIFRLEYAITLLNKDIEQLMDSQQLTVPDNRNILGNLKTLMLYLASKDLMYS